ncbi:hypothetical protein [Marinobacter sp. X15-166B]|uniref:hypothetical protein n=1 Tax=Marinobacter sp. X15-166B TaxID=1897620 RepID=UPI00085C2022|nr:hypothetical protein [Marinobacter sp. X15-166B]OEY66785.1 hypothetical protein BG841_10185 [Marinobacter sp. X15-166B]
MIKKGIKGLLVAGVLISGSAAAELNYTYAEGGLGILSTDGSQTLAGFDLRGSYAIDEHIFAFGGLRMLSDDVDYTHWHLGGGYRHALDASTDVWGGLSLEYQKVEFNSWSANDTAPAIRGGIRHQLDEQIEVGASARLVTGDFDYLGLTGHGRYRLQDNLSLTGEVDIQDGDFGLFAGATLFF